MDGRVWLAVPYAEKDAAKAAGARWDPQARRWYAPRPDLPVCRNGPKEPLIQLLKLSGEPKHG